jgi:hypothetical protein
MGTREHAASTGTGAHASTTGKGRKQRITPLTKATTEVLREWLAERGGQPDEPLSPTSTGTPLTRNALARRIATHAACAAASCPTLSSVSSTGCDYVAPDFSSASRFAGREPARCASGVGERMMARDGLVQGLSQPGPAE